MGAAAPPPAGQAPLNMVLGVMARAFVFCTASILALVSLNPSLYAAQQRPCPTFEHRSVNCSHPAIPDSLSPVTVISTDEIRDLEIVDSSSAIFVQHPNPLPPRCQLIGTIDKRIDLSKRTEPSQVVSISQFVDYLGANYVAFQKPSSNKWSKIFYCLNLE